MRLNASRRILLTTLLALGALATVGVGEAQLGRTEKAEVRLLVDRTSYAAGDGGRLAVVLTVDPGWHVNSHQPNFDYLIPTEVELELPEGWSAAELSYPPGSLKTFAFEDQPLSVYDGEIAVYADFAVPGSAQPGARSVEARVRYQACDDKSCLPPVTTTANAVLEIGSTGSASGDPVFASTTSGSSIPGSRMAVILLLGILGGLILNAMPCVLPVLSLKLFGLVESANKERSQVVAGSLATAAGILASFLGLALAAILARNAGAAVGWGVQFQEPGFVAFLTVIVALFCLNLWGLFEVQLPSGLMSSMDSGSREGLSGHFASGLFATLMATPCSAPFLGTAVGFALSQPALYTIAVFTAVGVGMALPYLLLAALPDAVRLLPRPGPWMESLKGLLGFLLASAAVWLFYVLAAQISTERLAFFQLALLVMALLIWLRQRADGSKLRRRIVTAGAVIAALAGLAIATGADGGDRNNLEEANLLIEWVPFDRAAAEELANGGHLVFVDVTADWCFTCKVNERLVLETEDVARAFDRHQVVAMKADWTNRNDDIAAFMAAYDRYGIPFYLLYRPGSEPHLFGELLTTDEVVRTVDEAGGLELAGGGG